MNKQEVINDLKGEMMVGTMLEHIFDNNKAADFRRVFNGALELAIEIVDQLDEPEITEEQALNKLAETLPISSEQLSSNIRKLVVHGGTVSYGLRVEDAAEMIADNIRLSELEQQIKGVSGMDLEQVKDEFVSGKLVVGEKVVVPQFVADWIEEHKEDFSLLWVAQEISEGLVNLDVDNWADNNFDSFAKAWLNGYEVEKETRYLMPVPYQKSDQVYYCGIGDNIQTKWSADKHQHHKYTQEELDNHFPDIKHMAIEVKDHE
ncbi:DUF1642 domain-containing protein [Marinilactibacillus sp. Marseille-P9653]|uniref:DUF1642 domain-containing protein n=1 Tax=Marinilactibacillus sp. Marseille-P9653 TaxID=2866583 RepID=UPI001CE3F117|nr:DUF1642 domain-containing protein [Marinilactibacillus sp. Marseille-P9653]